MFASRPPPAPSAPRGLGFIVASASLTPAFHLAGEAVASSDLQTQLMIDPSRLGDTLPLGLKSNN